MSRTNRLAKIERRVEQTKSMQRDALRWRALITHCRVSHVDDRDAEPVFEVQPPCIWMKRTLTDAVDAVLALEKAGKL